MVNISEIPPIERPIKHINVEDLWTRPVKSYDWNLLEDSELPVVLVEFYNTKTGDYKCIERQVTLDDAYESMLKFNRTHEDLRCVRVSKVNEFTSCKKGRVTLCAPMQDPVLWKGYKVSSSGEILGDEYLIPENKADEIEALVEFEEELKTTYENLIYMVTDGAPEDE